MRKANRLSGLLILTATLTFLTGCTQQTMVKEFGGDMTIDLEPGQKLEEITWKDEDSLWILTRPMTDDDVAEVHTFQESSAWGIVEGKVEVVEHIAKEK